MAEQLEVARLQLESRRSFIQLLRAQLALCGASPLPPGSDSEALLAGVSAGHTPLEQLERQQVAAERWLLAETLAPPRASLQRAFFRGASARQRPPQKLWERSSAGAEDDEPGSDSGSGTPALALTAEVRHSTGVRR